MGPARARRREITAAVWSMVRRISKALARDSSRDRLSACSSSMASCSSSSDACAIAYSCTSTSSGGVGGPQQGSVAEGWPVGMDYLNLLACNMLWFN
jgi:hypothetical protein